MWEQKSLDMKNLFLSPKQASDFTKIFIKLDMIQAEQRHARGDLAQIKHQLSSILDLTVNEETSPQTDTENIPEEEGI